MPERNDPVRKNRREEKNEEEEISKEDERKGWNASVCT
jgi:hypothetical protein